MNHNWREIVLLQGDCRKNCSYDYINRLAFRIFFTAFYSNRKRRTFCTRSQLTWRDFFPVIQCLIEEFCSCYTEPHRRVRAQAKTRNNNHSWTTNRAKLWMICDLLALRPISHITKKTLSYLHSTKIEQMTKTMVIFLKRRHFSLLHSLQSNTTTNFRPAARAYSQRYHLLFIFLVFK